ncbi:MAG TPA: protein kinase [Pyrinomonadaceae bacterium]
MPLCSLREGSPEMVSGYQIESLVEKGVNSATYGARQLASGGSCLIRILTAGDNTEDFLHEAKLASTFFHPNVVDVYDAGTLDDGEVFVVSEMPRGRTLRDFLNEGGVPKLLTSIEIVRQTAEALHAIHLAGFNHGAVSPENIILTEDPDGGLLVRLRNLDFGRAIERSITGNKFIVETVLGALRYFAPEQCGAEATNAQTDVYSLGVVFYELLAGAPPFDAATATALIHKHKNQPPPDVRIDDFHLRMLVTHSLTESLQKPARLRQPTANAFARQLRHIEQLATHVSTPPPAGTVSASPQPPKFSPAPVFDIPVREIPRPAVSRFEDEHVIAKVGTEIADHYDAGSGSVIEVNVEAEPQISFEAETAPEVVPEVELEQVESLETDASDVAADLDLFDIPVSATANADVASLVVSETTAPASTAFVRETSIGPARRSRLKHLKKKLHGFYAASDAARVLPIDDHPASPTIGAPTAEEPAIERPAPESTAVEDASALAQVFDAEPIGDLPIEEATIESAGLEVAEVEARNTEVTEAESAEVEVSEVHAADPVQASALQPEPAGLETAEPQIAEIETPEPESVEIPSHGPEPRKIAAGLVHRKRKRSELEQPKERLVVSSAEARELAEESTIDTPVTEVEPKPIETGLESAVTAPAKIKRKRKARAAAAGSERVRMAEMLESPPLVPKGTGEDDEDITLVRPRTRINVEWAKPRTIYRPDAFSLRYRDEVRFVPTLLGTQDTAGPIDSHAQGGMFAAHYTAAAERSAIPYRALTISCGVVALMALFLFGNDSLSKYFQSVSPGDSVTAQATGPASATKGTVATKEVLPPVQPITTSYTETSPRESAKPLTEVSIPSTSDVSSKTTAVKERSSTARDKVVAPVEGTAAEKNPAPPSKAEARPDSGRKKSKVEAEQRPVDKAPAAKSEKTSPATRPRIVKDPRD